MFAKFIAFLCVLVAIVGSALASDACTAYCVATCSAAELSNVDGACSTSSTLQCDSQSSQMYFTGSCLASCYTDEGHLCSKTLIGDKYGACPIHRYEKYSMSWNCISAYNADAACNYPAVSTTVLLSANITC